MRVGVVGIDKANVAVAVSVRRVVVHRVSVGVRSVRVSIIVRHIGVRHV